MLSSKYIGKSSQQGEMKMSKFLSKFSIFVLCIGFVLVLNIEICSAAMGKKFKENEYKHYHKKNTLSVSGEISIIRPTYIGVITHSDKNLGEETETIFIVDEDVTFKKKALEELLEGDTVKITYENITEPDPDDAENDKFVQRVTKEIHFLHSKSTSLKSGSK